MQTKQKTSFLSLVLYGLAIVTLFAALWILFSAIGFGRNATSEIEDLLNTFGPVSGLFARMFNNAVAILGMVFAGLTLTISALLFTAAQFVIHSNKLSDRITAIEDKLQALEGKAETT